MLIVGSSGSSGGLVGEHQPDEPIATVAAGPAGRWRGDERDEGLAAGHADAWVRMARGQRRNHIAVQAEQGAVAGRQD